MDNAGSRQTQIIDFASVLGADKYPANDNDCGRNMNYARQYIAVDGDNTSITLTEISCLYGGVA